MDMSISRRGRVAAIAGTAALAAAVVAGGTALAAGDSLHAAAGTIKVVSTATGGSAIPSTSARIGGTGIFTQLHGPKFAEMSIGALKVGDTLTLSLPTNFEFNRSRTTAPTVSGCDKKSSSISYPSASTARITIQQRTGASHMSVCTIDFGGLLMVRPVSSDPTAGMGGNMTATLVDPQLPMPQVIGNVGTIRMVVVAPTPSPTPTPVTVPLTVTSPATGGSAIPSTTARIGGNGQFTQLTGPTLMETAIGALRVGSNVTLTLPANFEWNAARTSAPSVTSCDKTSAGVVYASASVASITILQGTGPVQGSTCRIDFGSILQVRPIDASIAGSGNIIVSVTGMTFGASAGVVQTTTVTPPPTGALSLVITAPTMNNMAINWGEGLNITTSGTPGVVYQMQVTTTDPSSGTPTWETLTDSNAAVRNFTIGPNGSSTITPPYTPVRNYWYRAISGTNVSNIVRVTVRQTIVIRPESSSTQTVSAGTRVQFSATVRPARPELQPATVRFELYRRSGSSWVLSQTTNVVIDANGVARQSFTFNSGSWYVRAQAQPTPVNANSFWTPNQFYTAN